MKFKVGDKLEIINPDPLYGYNFITIVEALPRNQRYYWREVGSASVYGDTAKWVEDTYEYPRNGIQRLLDML